MNKLGSTRFYLRLHVKLLLCLGAFIVLGGLLSYFRWQTVDRDIDSLATEVLTAEQQRFGASRATTTDLIKALTYDYTVWDDMVRAVRVRDIGWFEDNLTIALDTYKVDAIWVFNTQHDELFNVARDGQQISFPIEDLATASDKLYRDGYFVDFNALIDGEVYQILGAPVQPTSDIDRVTTPKGYLFAARKLSREDILSRLRSLVGDEVKITTNTTVKQPSIAPKQGKFSFEDPIYDYQGNQIASYSIEGHSAYIEKMASTLYDQRLIFIGAMLIFVSVVGATIYLIITRPLRQLSKNIANHNPSELARLQKRHDEFGQAADLIIRDQEQELALKVAHRELQVAQKALEDQLRDVERINDLMVDRELKMIELKKEIKSLRTKSANLKKPRGNK